MSEPPSDNPAPDSRAELLKEYGFAALVGILLLLNVTGAFKTIFGLDTAILITALAGYKTFYNSVSALLEKRISADIALCVAVIAAFAVGEACTGGADRCSGGFCVGRRRQRLRVEVHAEQEFRLANALPDLRRCDATFGTRRDRGELSRSRNRADGRPDGGAEREPGSQSGPVGSHLARYRSYRGDESDRFQRPALSCDASLRARGAHPGEVRRFRHHSSGDSGHCDRCARGHRSDPPA